MTTRAEAIRDFLEDHTRPDLAKLYHAGMEVQVNVQQLQGKRKQIKNSRAVIWTDGLISWFNYRIPKQAWQNPEDNSHFDQNYSLETFAEGIGLTGWDFSSRKSAYVAYDFDALIGHSKRHSKKLTPEELDEVKQAACDIPWVTVRHSTGGHGLHLYVFLEPQIDTNNHSEHAALARAILAQMSALAGYDFESSVDTCGGNIWIWHRKYESNPENGLRLLKAGTPLAQIPINWRDHIPAAASRVRSRIKVGFINEEELDSLSGEFARVPLDSIHKALVKYLDGINALWWFDSSRHMLVTHTYDLKRAHDHLKMRGVFDTVATGKDHGADHNCFAYPLPNGAWVVRRYTKGVAEHACWALDRSGYQRCYYNIEPDLDLAARLSGAVKTEKGDYAFPTARDAIEALKNIKVELPELSDAYLHRSATIKVLEDSVALRIAKLSNELVPAGWAEATKTQMSTVVTGDYVVKHEDAMISGLAVDDKIRHLVDGRQGSGWAICTTGGRWYLEQESAVYNVLSHQYKANAIKKILGSCILNPWLVVNIPFQPEYPGDRQWNRDAAQFRFRPVDSDDWLCPTWHKVLNHCGVGLNDAVQQHAWCRDANITTGGEYLLYWAACMFRKPEQPLPYLFFYGPQNSGKSIFHQALSLIFLNKVGYVRAEAALQNPSAFNGELAGAVLCVVEEVDLSGRGGKMALARIKDYVGSDTIGLHVKGKTVILVQNTTHWVHCANDPGFCPIFPDDSRITMGLVPSLEPGVEIPKNQLLADLEKEGPNFLGLLLSLDIPEPAGRLAVPVINTADKLEAAALNASLVQQFISERAHLVPGHVISLEEFYLQFCDWVGDTSWTKQRISREMNLVPGIVRGRYNGPQWHYGNISWDRDAEPRARLIKNQRTESLHHEA